MQVQRIVGSFMNNKTQINSSNNHQQSSIAINLKSSDTVSFGASVPKDVKAFLKRFPEAFTDINFKKEVHNYAFFLKTPEDQRKANRAMQYYTREKEYLADGAIINADPNDLPKTLDSLIKLYKKFSYGLYTNTRRDKLVLDSRGDLLTGTKATKNPEYSHKIENLNKPFYDAITKDKALDNYKHVYDGKTYVINPIMDGKRAIGLSIVSGEQKVVSQNALMEI